MENGNAQWYNLDLFLGRKGLQRSSRRGVKFGPDIALMDKNKEFVSHFWGGGYNPQPPNGCATGDVDY